MIENVDRNNIEIALKKVKSGLEKYISIIDMLHKVNVSEDKEFQKLYNGFYKLIKRNPDFYEMYYQYLENNKCNEVIFKEAIEYIYDKTKRVEASFASKLVASINPNLPIWDSFVLSNLKINKPKSYKKSEVRVKESIEVYKILQEKYKKFLLTADAKALIEIFDKEYQNARISDTKKIDFILWQIR